MCKQSFVPRTFLDLVIISVLRCLSLMLLLNISDTIKTPDTCGSYFLLPVFPGCQLFLEVVPCVNHTNGVFIKLTTNSGKVVHTFNVNFGVIARYSLDDINKAKHEGIIVTSNGEISLYVHKTMGDSMIVYPIDALSQEYEIPSLTSFNVTNTSSANNNSANEILYIFSTYNDTTITITSLHNKENSSSKSASTFSPAWKLTSNISFDAFTIYKYHVDSFRRYTLHSSNIFGVVLVQIRGAVSTNDSICRNSNLTLIDFVPPYSTSGKQFFIAFPTATDFTLIAMGLPNTTIDLTTGHSPQEIILDQLGMKTTDVLKATTCWISASVPVIIYIKITFCSNTSLPTIITLVTTNTAVTTTICKDNGFFLPSLDQYFKCDSNMSKEDCACICPSVFQRIFNPTDFTFLRNTNDSLLNDKVPLAFGDLFDLTVSISPLHDFKNAADIIVVTNTSFLVFRYNFDTLQIFTSGYTLQETYISCVQDINPTNSHACNISNKTESQNHHNNDTDASTNFPSEINECSCQYSRELVNDNRNTVKRNPLGSRRSKLKQTMADEIFFWEEEDDDSARPLIAVVVSLCVAIFAVVALISGYMLVEVMTRRKHVRNTRIRPFVS